MTVWAGVPDDPYIDRSELDTVSLELRAGVGVVASVSTVLDASHDSEARALVDEVASGLESGSLEPTASAVAPLADTPR